MHHYLPRLLSILFLILSSLLSDTWWRKDVSVTVRSVGDSGTHGRSSTIRVDVIASDLYSLPSTLLIEVTLILTSLVLSSLDQTLPSLSHKGRNTENSLKWEGRYWWIYDPLALSPLALTSSNWESAPSDGVHSMFNSGNFLIIWYLFYTGGNLYQKP